jgi:hypothetical protein
MTTTVYLGSAADSVYDAETLDTPDRSGAGYRA